MPPWLCLLLGIAGWWGLGLAVFELIAGLSREPGQRTRGERLGCGLLLGIGLTSWIELVWCLAGGSLGRTFSLGLATTGCLLGFGVLLQWGLSSYRSEVATGSPSASHLTRLCQGLIGILWINLLVQTLLTPQRFWDERAIFGLKGTVLFEDRTVNSADLADPDFVQYHPRYPLLLPLAEQHVYALLGETNDRWSKAIPPLLGLGLVLSFAGVLSRRFGQGPGWLTALLLITLPVLATFELGLLSAQADAPVAALHGASVLYCWDWLSSRHRSSGPSRPLASLVAAGVLAGLAGFTKDEGLAFLMVDAVALSLILLATGSSPLPQRAVAFAAYGIPAMVLLVPWLWHRRSLPETTEMAYLHRLTPAMLAAGWPAAWWSLRHLGSRMFLEAFEWGLQWWGMLGSAIACPRRMFTAAQLFLLLDVLGALASLVVAGMIAPTPVEEHIGGSAHRFLMQLTPVAVLFLAGQVGPAGKSQGDGAHS